MIKTVIADGSGKGQRVAVEDNCLLVANPGYPPLVSQKTKIFRQYMTGDGLSTGSSDMKVGAGTVETDGACADHTGPTYTFTSATGGLDGAQRIQVTDTGDSAHAVVGFYIVSSVTDTNTVELTTDPTDGTNEVGINFTVMSVLFWIPADGTDDRYITQLSFLIEDAAAAFNKFGGETALTTGCELHYYREGEKVVIHDALKSNWDFVRLCIFSTPAFGDAATAYEYTNTVGTSDSFAPVLDFTRIMPPFGLKLDAGSSQKLVLEIKSPTFAIDGFNCIGYGFDRHE